MIALVFCVFYNMILVGIYHHFHTTTVNDIFCASPSEIVFCYHKMHYPYVGMSLTKYFTLASTDL